MENDVAPVQEETTNETANLNLKKRENLRIALFGFLGFLVVILVGTLGITIYRVYAKAATDPFTATVAKVFRLPVLKVNGVTALYSDYIDDLKAISVLRDYDKANNGPGANLTPEQMSDQVLLRLMNNILVKEAAKAYDVKVEEADVKEIKSTVLAQFKTVAEADRELEQRYGWNMATYEKKVMMPFILQNKLAEKIQTDQARQAEVLARAQDILNQVKNGGNFEELAKKYGEDGTAESGGDLGWFGKGEMVPQFEAAAFALKKGELSQTLVETPYGYHVLKVVDRKVEKVKDDRGKMVSQEQIKASHILLLFPSISKYLDALLRQSSIHLYVNVHNPLQALQK
ncbi:MAG: hypothetical protein A2754_02695 [Candidatus Magasanikbacteria bacterium RIFCSPHIGHO2_01_FULL_47_8]|uniref:PpiC domain-containing protein n=1 Tax=Candidatus Magasanikbacteria bacterium RIFCSPHIGHO2_01_FULL_47_8 TaxID=1798673 RepID=A0A1F6MCL6_9BACT|nr:MAG: hypothetical protein A2754_02695 [Candidatus Magasanikbacteria bacterium RIFCSPHIGHO2_01_FULL_47_8]